MSLLNNYFSELEIGNSAESFKEVLVSQKELFHSQINQLQKIVVAQCRLTGVNPLSQEMAAGALSIKIGKRPRDLLNPKATKYMQSVFSIKDAISKKESREISALFGVTVTQVRDFFASQRSRVRKLVRISRERGMKPNGCKEPQDGVVKEIDPVIPLNPVPLNTIVPAPVEEAPSSLTQDEMLSGIDDLDKHFVENIFDRMRTEETFTGQVKLMEWILKIQNPTVLLWFSTKGGLSLLASWLSEAAVEEQTSVLHVILKVLYHLPLQKVLPVHLSAVLQGVNKLRFYKSSDISNRAKALLARWSKSFARNQALRKPNEMKSSSYLHKESLPSQSVGEIMGVDSWKSNFDGEILASLNDAENIRKLESSPSLKLLPAPSDDPSRKNASGISSSQTRERRKVQLVEQPGHKTIRRSTQTTRAAAVNQGRPMSADDIQKAKMRAQFMQSKYSKAGSSLAQNKEVKTEVPNNALIAQHNTLSPASKGSDPQRIEELKKPPTVPPIISSKPQMVDTKVKTDIRPSLEMCKKVPWQKPPELRLDGSWSVSAGEDSKEIEVQKNRNRREKETIYQKVEEIPPNPKDPWDLEMDFDDSLTPEIPLEQLPDDDNADTQVASNGTVTENDDKSNTLPSVVTPPAPISSGTTTGAEPDFELLAVLLKNPELVFALTSGQTGNLSAEQTMKLLDTIKTGGVNPVANLNGMSGKVEEKVQVSLPSPTPSNDPGTSGWRQEVAKNPFSQRSSLGYSPAPVITSIPTPESKSVASLWQPRIQAGEQMMHQQHTNTFSQQQQQQLSTPYSPQVQPTVPSLQQSLPAHSLVHQTLASSVAKNNLYIPSLPMSNLQSAAMHSMQAEGPSGVHTTMTQERQSVMYQKSPMLSSATPSLYESRQLTAQRPQVGQVSDPWRAQPDLASDQYLQPNQANYNMAYGGPARHPVVSGPSRDEKEFESWSPDKSPDRPLEYVGGRIYAEPRMNYDRNYRPEQSRPRNFSGFRDHNGQGNRRWNDRRY